MYKLKDTKYTKSLYNVSKARKKSKKSLYVDISCFIIVAMVTHCATKRPFYHVYVGKNFYGGCKMSFETL